MSALAYLRRHWKVVLLFAAFYPVLTGVRTPTWYTTGLLKWFPSWPF